MLWHEAGVLSAEDDVAAGMAPDCRVVVVGPECGGKGRGALDAVVGMGMGAAIVLQARVVVLRWCT